MTEILDYVETYYDSDCEKLWVLSFWEQFPPYCHMECLFQ